MSNPATHTTPLSRVMDDVTANSGYLQLHVLGKQVSIIDVIHTYRTQVSVNGEHAFDDDGFIAVPAIDMEGALTTLRANQQGFEELFVEAMAYFDRGVAANGPQIKPTEAYALSQRAIG